MFSCTACFRRTLHNLTLDHPRHSVQRRIRKHCLQNLVALSHPARRGHATYDSLQRGHHRRLLRKALQDNAGLVEPNNRRKGPGALTKGEIKDAIARQRNRENSLVIKNDDSDKEMQRRLKKEVELHHQDPISLAKVVQKRLRSFDLTAALNLVRASDGVVAKNVVSWNHLIDFCMAQGEPDKAWRIYNETKKRGNTPDAHTYTIMLRGLSMNAKKADAAEKAVSIYNSMFAPNSKVTPNTIHTNAVLNVCARRRDMDSIWAIAGKLPETGPGCPDRWTYTTILNAIREDAIAKVADLLKNPNHGSAVGQTVEERQQIIFDEALQDGRKLWADVEYRWRRANLVVDEPLICAMGRLILGCGTKRDYRQVFDLVDRTMNIRLADRAPSTSSTYRITGPHDGTAAENTAVADHVQVDVAKSSGLPVDESLIYARPGNNALSMIMQAALGTKEMKTGKAYWDMLTSRSGVYRVEPDTENIMSYLRVLRISRSSKAVLELLSHDWPAHIASRLYRRGTFVIALSTCIRDKNNPGVFETADKLLLLMQQKLEEADLGVYNQSEAELDLSAKERMIRRKEQIAQVDDTTFGEEEARAELQRTKSGVESMGIDPKALRMYIDLALITTRGWHEGLPPRSRSSNEDEQQSATKTNERFERDQKKNSALKALRRLSPMLGQIRRLAKMKIEEAENARFSDSKLKHRNRFEKEALKDYEGTRIGENLEDLIDLLRTAVSGYDRVITMAERFEDEGLEPLNESMITRFRENKRIASAFLSRTKEEVAKSKAKKYEFTRFRNRSDHDDELEEDDEEGIADTSENEWVDEDSNERSGRVSRSTSSPPRFEERQLARDIRRVYEDTDRDLNRTHSRSRRQRNERRRGVEIRMTRRLGKPDYGLVNENLQIENEAAVERRMKQRAFGINTSRDSLREESAGGNIWGKQVFEQMTKTEEPETSFATTKAETSGA